MKTTYKYYKQLHEPVRQMALVNMNNNGLVSDFACAISAGMAWSETPQGHAFWEKEFLQLDSKGEAYIHEPKSGFYWMRVGMFVFPKRLIESMNQNFKLMSDSQSEIIEDVLSQDYATFDQFLKTIFNFY